MSVRGAWSTAFPIRPAAIALQALYRSWCTLASKPRPGFKPRTREPVLTRVLKAHVEQVTGPQYGLLGMWAAESVHNEIDLVTAEIRKEYRTDIIYGWNNDRVRIEFVFEFKKLNRRARTRNNYLGVDGLGRFVNGVYARGQPMAAMVGILTDPIKYVLPALKKEIEKETRITELRIRLGLDGVVIQAPSALFPSRAKFDTEHERRPELLALDHDTIRVAHIFFEFGYAH